MNRRTYLSSLAATTVVFSGCSALGKSPEDSQPEYYGQENVVYEHDKIDLNLRQETVHLGDSIEVEITNTSDSEVFMGCHAPWALQKYSDGDWRHVTWTAEGYFDLCTTRLTAGSSLVQGLTLSKSELENQADEVRGDLTSGKYRFVVIGMSPYVALDFDVLESE